VIGTRATVLPAGCSESFRKANIPFVRSPERALRALAQSTRYAHRRILDCEVSAEIASYAADPLPAGIVPEYLGKRLLAKIGIQSPQGASARDVGEACRITAEIGFPVALNAQAVVFARKSDVGGVALRVSSEAMLRARCERLNTTIGAAKPGVVEAIGNPGLEFMVGAKRDPEWGAVLLVDLGGVEASHDVRVLSVSSSPEEIREQPTKLRASALLGSLRGQPARDVPALVDAIGRVGALIERNREIVEVDINPVAVGYEGQGVLALDALITVELDYLGAAHGL
jgi:acetate---CoA ligase (ADP-forming)